MCGNVFYIRKSNQQEKKIIESEHIKGAGNKAAGELKQAAGKAIGNKEMQAKGKGQELKGKVQDKIGDVKDVFKK